MTRDYEAAAAFLENERAMFESMGADVAEAHATLARTAALTGSPQ
ncbi:hypothetical protein [Caudoviricetes sp.]|nr:hypothetical protein [Caudoviricetes sp.]